MSLIRIDETACNHDGLCVKACPLGLLEQSGGEVPVEIPAAEELCIHCGHCVAICPTAALTHSGMPQDDFTPAPAAQPDAGQVEALLLGRRSVRDFRKAPVSRENLEPLLEVARRAPTASNSQNVAWIMIQDAERLERIISLTVAWLADSPRGPAYARLIDSGRDVVLRGATTLALAHTPEDYPWCDVDCAIALTYMELHAASLGLGVCWGGLVTAASRAMPDLREALGLQDGRRLGGALMLGQPRSRHRLVPPRNPVSVDWL